MNYFSCAPSGATPERRLLGIPERQKPKVKKYILSSTIKSSFLDSIANTIIITRSVDISENEQASEARLKAEFSRV